MYGYQGVHCNCGSIGASYSADPMMRPGGFRMVTGGPSIFGTGYMNCCGYNQIGYKMHDLQAKWEHDQMMYEKACRQEKVKTVVKSTAGGLLAGAAAGAAIGALGGPIGAVGGAVIGGICGLVKGIFS